MGDGVELKNEIFFLPWPPSVNSVYRMFVMGKVPRMIISKQGREYFSKVAGLVKELYRIRFEKARLKVRIIVYPPDRRRRDLDNLGKVTLDSLQKAGIYRDDEQIDELIFLRCEVRKPGEVVVTIEEIVPHETKNAKDVEKQD